MKIAYFDCFSGASGDMIVGSLLDAGVKATALKAELAKLKLHGYKIRSRRVTRGMLSAKKFDVAVSHGHHEHRTLRDIEALIDRSRLSERVKEQSKAVFARLARAEAKVHRKKIDQVHFHEVGAVDSIVDIVGAAIGFEQLDVDKIYFSPIRVGTGTIKCQHGILPVPAPATAELIKGLPVVQTDMAAELTTPTGAAVLTALGRCSPPPPMRYAAVGQGAGGRDHGDLPNVLRVMVGERRPGAEGDRVCVIETNIDDMPAEIIGYVSDKLFEAGALDVYAAPIQMKKNRPGVLLSVIAEHRVAAAVEQVLFRETTTFGVRRYEVERSKLAREHVKVRTSYGTVRVKVGRLDGEVITVAPEYEDCRRAAERSDAPLKDVRQAALNAAGHLIKG